ncbi:methyltransferase domain-containing protein [Desulfovermiculus halophilus]|jgi:phosphoethanolamine N-methyltransferase|uniref:methyltransferase domain-containing protein n=1 Tax=Desulfovermiculus halophilus TaxID=339722 RepID=UPI000483D56C|nr:methyltransferase domain-containing protein [Desulfovermiculus halophilus]
MANDKQYSTTGIYRYEWIFGPGFLGYGEPQVTRQIIEEMNWQPGIRVLDVGSGLGGPAFLMATEYKARVTGVDLTQQIVDIANQRLQAKDIPDVSFLQGDIHQMDWGEGAFDVIWSRETLLHVPDKDALFQKFYRWLAPGGKVMITDYARKPGQGCDQFESYIQESGYPLLQLERYGDHIRQAGFEQVQIQDKTDLLISILQDQLHRLDSRKEEFIAEFSEDDYAYLRSRWKLKLECCQDGDMKWGWFSGRRPEK